MPIAPWSSFLNTSAFPRVRMVCRRLVSSPAHAKARGADIYIGCLSSLHAVCPKGKYLAFVSSIAESADPTHELDYALRLIEPIEERFMYVSPIYEPNEPGTRSKVFISKSYDASRSLFCTI